MQTKIEVPTDVAGIVGRFQVSSLHEAHIELIQSVVDKHPKVLLFLGLSPLKGTINNPLDFEARKQMILEKFPDINVLYLKDCRDDKDWSKNLDRQIEDLITPNQKIMLYGSRDSFIPRYHGKFPTIELQATRSISGTEIRKRVSAKVRPNEDFRRGVIWDTFNRHPVAYTTVDVAVMMENRSKVLLARKPAEKAYRFIGGFVSPSDSCLEAAAKRETHEESGLETSYPEYIGSTKIRDWRFDGEQDGVQTTLWIVDYLFGAWKPADDISELRIFEVAKLAKQDMMEEHHVLLEMLHQKLSK